MTALVAKKMAQITQKSNMVSSLIEEIQDIFTEVNPKASIDLQDIRRELELRVRKFTNPNLVDSDLDAEKAIGRKMKAAREELKMTQIQLAEKLKVSQSEIAKMENGDRSFSEEKVESLSLALKKPYEYFFE